MNTVASNGTAVTLSLLVQIALQPALASATNRVPVLLGVLVAGVTFIRAGIVVWKLALKIVAPCNIGAIFGAMIADNVLRYAIQALIIIAVVMAIDGKANGKIDVIQKTA